MRCWHVSLRRCCQKWMPISMSSAAPVLSMGHKQGPQWGPPHPYSPPSAPAWHHQCISHTSAHHHCCRHMRPRHCVVAALGQYAALLAAACSGGCPGEATGGHLVAWHPCLTHCSRCCSDWSARGCRCAVGRTVDLVNKCAPAGVAGVNRWGWGGGSSAQCSNAL